MDRAEQLRKLSREHHDSLVFARTIGKISKEGSQEELANAITSVVTFYDDELEPHFQHEEHTIFKPIFKEFREHVSLATTLVKEHGLMRILIPNITPETAKEDLEHFSEILKNHTHFEERELFPIVEKLFSDEQLDAVLNFTPIN